MHAPVRAHVLLGQAMREVRDHLGVAQAALAGRMGNRQSYIARFENAHELPGSGDGGAWQRWQTAVGDIAASKPRDSEWQAALHDKLAVARRLHAQAKVQYAAERASIVGAPRTEVGDWVRRRDFVGLAGSALAATVLSPGGMLHELAVALTRYQSPADVVGRSDLDGWSLGEAVRAAKLEYQACRYANVVERLPGLLARLDAATGAADGDERLRVEALRAQAYHVAASVLLKSEDQGLAWVAADRSMQAAQRSQNPVIVGASARIVVHALISGSHYGPAKELAGSMGARLEALPPTAAALSVYGALLLRGAIAAAKHEDGDTAHLLLDEADQAAERLGGDFNHQWTAFGPTNVGLHRVTIEVALGNAGTAIDHARRIELDKIDVTERKAALFIDTARAFAQWGKYDPAVAALATASDLAHEELRVRPAVHQLITEIDRRASSHVRAQLADLADRIGMAR